MIRPIAGILSSIKSGFFIFKELVTTSFISDANLKFYLKMDNNSTDVKGACSGTDTSMTYSTGIFGLGAIFNGSNATINIGTNAALNVTTAFTIHMRVYLNSYVGVLIAKGATASAYPTWSVAGIAGGGLGFYSGTSTEYNSPLGIVPLNTWFDLDVVHEGSGTNQHKVYVNASLVASLTVPDSPTSVNPCYIGCWRPGFGHLNGKIDDIALFSRALSASEISQLYGASVSQINSMFVGGGMLSGVVSNIIDYIDQTTITGSAMDTGDITLARYTLKGCNNATYGFFAGGSDGTNYQTIIDYINITVPVSNAVSRGSLLIATNSLGSCSGPTYGFFGGGWIGSNTNAISYIDMTLTSGNAISKGTLTAAIREATGCAGTTYGFFAGGYTTTWQSKIDYINVTTTSGNAASKGTLTIARDTMAGCVGTTYGFFAGGSTPSAQNRIDYIDITTTTGNATTKGTLTGARYSATGHSGSTYGFFAGGSTGTDLGVIDYIDVTTTTGNASDKGFLTLRRGSSGSV